MWEEGESVNHESSSTDADWILVMISPPFWQLSLVFFSFLQWLLLLLRSSEQLSKESHVLQPLHSSNKWGSSFHRSKVLYQIVSPPTQKLSTSWMQKKTFVKVYYWVAFFLKLIFPPTFRSFCIHLYFCAHKKCIHFESLPTLKKPGDLRMRGYLKVLTVYCAAIGR